MNYFIIILFVLFPVFSFAADEKESTPPEWFVLDQSRLDSGAVLGGTEPDSKLVQRAEAGDVEAMVRLYDFYKQEGETTKANDYLNRAAEKGHIPSLKLIYQQTGEILLTGLEAAVNAQVFAPLRTGGGGRTEFGLIHFSYMDYLSSPDGLQEESSRMRSSIISQITDGEKDSLVETSRAGDRTLRGQPVRSTIMELAEDGAFREVEPGVRMGHIVGDYKPTGEASAEPSVRMGHIVGDYEPTRPSIRMGHIVGDYEPTRETSDILDSLKILDRYVAYRLENIETRMEYWLGRLKNVANTGDMRALQMVYRITGEVLAEGYTKAVSNTIDSFFAEGREQGVSPKMTAMQNRESVSESITEQIKAPFVEGVEGLMFDLYEGYQAKGDAEGTTNWLNQLKKRANEGHVPTLRIVYHITGEVLATGLNTAVGRAMDSLFTEGREQGASPKMTAMQNREGVRNNILERIKTPFGKCLGAFSK